MKCYKEVHKYNGKYYSHFDNNYEFQIGTIAKAQGDYIYATDTIDNVLDYAYVPYDMRILEMETVGKYNQNGYVITCKEMKIIREVDLNERFNTSREKMAEQSCSELYNLLQQRKERLLSSMQVGH